MAKVWSGGNSTPKDTKKTEKKTNDHADIKKAEDIGKQKSRLYTMMQYFNHPVTGEELFTMENLKEGLNHKTITGYSWIIHDKDVWHEFDAPFKLDGEGNKIIATDEDGTPKVDSIGEKYYERDLSYVGKARPAHIHINLELKVQTPIKSIANWFSIPMRYIQKKKGAGVFLELTEYLTHEADNQQDLGKHLYSDDEVHVSDSYAHWREKVDEKRLSKDKYGKELNLTDYYQMQVLEGKMTVNDILQSEDRDVLLALGTGGANWIDKLYKTRATYLKKQNPPETRINYYLTGKGGSGKGLLSKALARSLYPNLNDDRDIFYHVGQHGNLFDSYDGQPVIIWDDFRGEHLIKALGSRGDVFNVFESHPTMQRVNKKFGETALVNTVNIVNSVQEPSEFVHDIVGEQRFKDGRIKVKGEDPNQVYRRFPVFIFIDSEYYDMYISEGFLDDNKDYDAYVREQRMRQNLRNAISMTGPRNEVYLAEENRTVRPIVDRHKELAQPPKPREADWGGGEVLDDRPMRLNMRTGKHIRQTELDINTDDDAPF